MVVGAEARHFRTEYSPICCYGEADVFTESACLCRSVKDKTPYQVKPEKRLAAEEEYFQLLVGAG